MKKFVAILLAAMFVLSASVMAFAEYDEEGDAVYTCDICNATFENAASLADHISATFPDENHVRYCGNEYDKNHDGEISEDEKCPYCTTYRAALAAHLEVCDFVDDESNWEKAWEYLKTGEIGLALKYLGKAIVEFVKSDTFKTITSKIGDLLGNIDLSSVISTVKGLIEKIPFSDIIAKVQGLVG